jgi:hypothetical protein
MPLDWLGAIGAVGGLAGGISAYISWREWKKTNRKIAMLNNVTKAAEVLPAWYTTRMMQDYWTFGLLTISGQIIVIKQITAISDDGKWMDVLLAHSFERESREDIYENALYAVAGDRNTASVQIDKIIAAFELETS